MDCVKKKREKFMLLERYINMVPTFAANFGPELHSSKIDSHIEIEHQAIASLVHLIYEIQLKRVQEQEGFGANSE